MLRSFIAVSIHPNDAVASLMKSIGPLRGSKVPHSKLMHITLAFLDEITENEKDQLCRIIHEIEFGKFEIRTTHIDAFPDIRRARVSYIGIDSPSILELHRILREKLPEKFRENREFVPHITISRFKRTTDIRGLLRENEDVDFGTYPVEKMTLYRSDLTPQGAVYTEICSVQLI